MLRGLLGLVLRPLVFLRLRLFQCLQLTAHQVAVELAVRIVGTQLLVDPLREAVARDASSEHKRPIVAIVDVKSQAYGYREEMLGIHLACAAAVDAYASARDAGHPVIALIVGPAMSGAFLAHGYQANRIVALDAPGTMVHAMGKEALYPFRLTLPAVAKLGFVHHVLSTAEQAAAPAGPGVATT